MSRILSIAHTPPTTVPPGATVQEAVEAMVHHRVGAVAIVEGEKLKGIFTERDLMVKVVAAKKDPTALQVREVMTTEVQPLQVTDSAGAAMRVMTQRHFRHMPVCGEDSHLLGILSIRNLLQHHVEKLAVELDSLEAFLTADGPGG